MKDYKFTCVPKNLMLALDANCKVMLFTLVQYSDYTTKDDGWFCAPNINLQRQSGLSKNLVIATLDTLYQAGIIDIECIGAGTGHKSNRIKVNTYSFDKYDEYKADDILDNPGLQIRTVQYKNNYTPSYLPKSKKECKEVCKKVNTIIDNIDNIENINNKITKEQITEVIDIPIIEKENLKEKESEMPNNWTRDTNRPGLGQVYLDDDLIRSLTDNERSIQLEYYYILRDLRKLELNKNKESCFSSQTIDWIGDHNIYNLRECMRNWNEGGRTELAQLIECLTPALRKEIMIYLVLNCKAADTSENNKVYQQVYAA